MNDVFDLERFRSKNPAWAKRDAAKRKILGKRKRRPRRPPVPAPFGSFPYACSDKLQNARAPWTVWALLFHLDRLIYGPDRREPLTTSAEFCKSCCLSQRQVKHALRQLERAGLIAVCRRRGRHNLVTALWRLSSAAP